MTSVSFQAHKLCLFAGREMKLCWTTNRQLSNKVSSTGRQTDVAEQQNCRRVNMLEMDEKNHPSGA